MVFCYSELLLLWFFASVNYYCYGFLLLSLLSLMVPFNCSPCYLLWFFATVLQSLLEWLELLDLYVFGLSYSPYPIKNFMEYMCWPSVTVHELLSVHAP